jgi:hypothetical protein
MSAEWKSVPTKSSIFMRILLILCVTSALGELSRAQGMAQSSSQGKHLGLYLSTGIASYREDLIVPLGFNGPALSIGGVYRQQSENDLFHVRLRFGLGHLKNRYSHEAWGLMQDIRLSWVRHLKEHPKYGQFWAGGSLPLQMNNLFFESWDDSHLYWLTAHSLAGAFLWHKRISPKNDLSVRIEIPFFSWVSRPPTYRYAKQDPLDHFTYHYSEPNKSLHFETIDTYRNVFIQMLLKREMGRSLFHVGLEFQSYYFSRPKKILGLNTFLVLSYQWRIGR